jgi:hypothetical protein
VMALLCRHQNNTSKSSTGQSNRGWWRHNIPRYLSSRQAVATFSAPCTIVWSPPIDCSLNWILILHLASPSSF